MTNRPEYAIIILEREKKKEVKKMKEEKVFLKIEKILNKFTRSNSPKEKEFFDKLQKSHLLAARSIGVSIEEIEMWLNYTI